MNLIQNHQTQANCAEISPVLPQAQSPSEEPTPICQVQAPGYSGKRLLFHFCLALIVPLLLLYFFRAAIICVDGETDPDAYYHAKLAEQGPRVFLAKRFPALTLSLWQEHFSDKELGFHFLLWGLHRARSLFGWRVSAPFHYYALALQAGLLSMIALTLLYWRVPCPLYYNLLFIGLYYIFSLRLLFVRAYMLAMLLLVLMVLLLSMPALRGSRWRLPLVCLLGFLYAWCYSNPHFVLVPSTAFALAEFLQDRKLWRLPLLPLAALVGAVLGLTLHPQFPNTWLILKVQGWDVLKMIFGAGAEAGIRGGNEFYIKPLDHISRAPFLLGLPLLLAALVWRSRNHWFSKDWSQRVEINALFILFLCSNAAFLNFFRFVEFSMPCSILFTALLFRDSLQASRQPGGRRIFAAQHLPGIYALCAFVFLLPALLAIKGNNHRPFTELAAWVQRNSVPEGSIIANPRWGSFPMLYYSMPNMRYLGGLDPMFSYAQDPQKTLVLEEFRTARKIIPAKQLKELTGAIFLFVSASEKTLASEILRHDYKSVYVGRDGWLFAL
ncbi:MAG: hypothetical protein PHG44_02185 [Lentisphaeria bacterium]|jgi:hypothetical protein|nr:hypothetical protein [Lentisphaeria bacterium]